MALTRTALYTVAAGWDTASDLGYTSASITPGANCVLICGMYGVQDNAGALDLFSLAGPNFTIVSSGTGPTWTKQGSSAPTTGFDPTACVYTAVIGGTDPGSFTVTVDFPSNLTAGQFIMRIIRYTGHDTTTPFAGIRTTAHQAGTGAVSTTVTATPATGDYVEALSGADSDAARDATFDSTARTWTTDWVGSSATGIQICGAGGYSTGSTSTTVAWSQVNPVNNFNSAQWAIIVKAAAASGPVGTIAATQASDAGDLNGTAVGPPFVGTINATQAANAGDLNGNVANPGATVGTIAATQASDAGDLNGTVVNFYVGQLQATQQGDAGDLNGTVTNPGIAGRIAVTQASNVADLTGSGATVAYPASKSGRKWLDQFGRPIQIRTLSSWGMVQRLSNTDITTAVANAAARGFNALTVDLSAGMNLGSGWNPGVNSASGLAFWTGTAFQSTLGPAWASHVVRLMDELTAHNMYLIASCYAGNGSQTTTKAAMTVASNAQMRTAGQRWATALAGYSNWVIHYGLDDSSGPDSKFDSLVLGIQDIRGPILCVGEPNQGSDALTEWPVGTFSSADMEEALYNYGANSVELWESTYIGDPRTPDGPVWDCEPLYIGHSNGGNQGLEKRYRHYTVPIEGGIGINNGHEDWWTFGAAGVGFTAGDSWPTAMNNTIVQDWQRGWTIWDLCNTTGWDATSALVTTGEGFGNSKAAQGTDGNVAIAYFPDNRTIQVDTTIIAGTANVRLRWYDPVAGTFSTISATEAQQTGRSVTLPAARGDGTRDFVLVVDSPDRVATVNATQQGDSADLNGLNSVPRVGTIAATQASDAADLNGTVAGPPRTGTIAATQADNVADLNGNHSGPGNFVGTINVGQQGNVADLNGTSATGVPNVKIGVNTISKIYAGSNQVTKVYLGSTQL